MTRALEEDRKFMREALKLAEQAGEDIPVGALIVRDGDIIAAAANEKEKEQDPTAHAEIVAIKRACQVTGSWRLGGTTLYTTLEPCPMCAGAFINARILRVVYGCDDPRAGALRSLYALGEDTRFNHRYEVLPGVRADECAEVLRAFCRARRREKKAARG